LSEDFSRIYPENRTGATFAIFVDDHKFDIMRNDRVSIFLSAANFMQLIFLGFAGSFVSEIIKAEQNQLILFWSSLFTLALAILIVYLYLEAFSASRHE